MKRFLQFLNHRDVVLTLALVLGLALGEKTRPLSEISVYTLALVMVFATTGFSFRSWIPVRNALIPLAWSTLLNFVVFGLLLVGISWLAFGNETYYPLYVGMVLVAAAPPGPSVIPFASMLKGDDNFSVTGVFGLHLLAMIITPLMLLVFLGQSLVNPWSILGIMTKLIVIPLLISRLLRHRAILPRVEKIRDSVIKWGFFLVIMPIMGMSSKVFFADPGILIVSSILLILSMYVLALGYHFLMKRLGYKRSFIVSSTFMMVTKSSAFSAVVAFSFFAGDPMIALPSAIVSVYVTLFVVFYGWVLRFGEK